MGIFKSELTGTFYGKLGEESGFEGLRVGDVVVFERRDKVATGVVVNMSRATSERNVYGIMGYGSGFEVLKRSSIGFRCVMKHNILTNNYLKDYVDYSIQICDLPRMTYKQLKQIVGNDFEFVEGEEYV